MLLRHADAGAARADADDSRRLTPAGIRAVRARARELKRRVPAFDLILTSPLPRAAQTAAIVARAYRRAPVRFAALAPAQAHARLLQRLRRLPGASILLVGHEPNLSQLAGWLTANPRDVVTSLTKAGCCALSLRDWRAGRAALLWQWD